MVTLFDFYFPDHLPQILISKVAFNADVLTKNLSRIAGVHIHLQFSYVLHTSNK
jgi:hypothetical protein